MYRSIMVVTALLIILIAGTGHAKDIRIGEKFTFDSKIIGEKTEFWISLPRTYKKNGYKKYPVLYFLDAGENYFFQTYSSMIKQMNAGISPQIPEMIFVGLVSKSGSERFFNSTPTQSSVMYGGKINQSIKTGGADSFLDYIKSELIPHIDRNYNTSDFRVLSGYSVTGLAVIHAFQMIPNTFNGYLAVDPSLWWDDKVMLKRTDGALKSAGLEKRRLFVTTSHRVGAVFPKENSVLEYIQKMELVEKDGLAFGSEIFGLEENHQTMSVMSFYKGFRYIFDGYMIDEETRFRPAHELKAHFQNVSDKLGSTFHLNEGLVKWFASENLYNDQFVNTDVERAIGYLLLNVENYPESFYAWDSLGEGYLVKGDNKLALSAFKKSLELNPRNQNAQEKIKKIGSNNNQPSR